MLFKKTSKNTKEEKEDKMKEEKLTLKERIKKFLKNKKAVGLVMEYIIIVECFAMIFLLTTPPQTKATINELEGNNTVLSSETEELEIEKETTTDKTSEEETTTEELEEEISEEELIEGEIDEEEQIKAKTSNINEEEQNDNMLGITDTKTNGQGILLR